MTTAMPRTTTTGRAQKATIVNISASEAASAFLCMAGFCHARLPLRLVPRGEGGSEAGRGLGILLISSVQEVKL